MNRIGELELNKIYLMDCLEGMELIPDKSIDMILCDLPYGTTGLKWDSVIPFIPLWERYNRIIKDNGAIVLFGNEPFSSTLRMSNIKYYKYDWIWKKTSPSGHLNAKKQPLRTFENIMVFYKKQSPYFPQGLIYESIDNSRPNRARERKKGEHIYGQERKFGLSNAKNYPKNILEYANPNNNLLHPTQKPTDLLEYLIKTYTKEGETILDNCIGSGSAAIAAIRTNRNFIGFENDEKFWNVAKERIGKEFLIKNAEE